MSHSVGNNDLGDVKDVTGSVSGIFGIDSLALFGSEAGGRDALRFRQRHAGRSRGYCLWNGGEVRMTTKVGMGACPHTMR